MTGQPIRSDEFVARNLVAVSDSDLVKMGKDPTKQVRVPPQFKEQFGDGALATTEYAHQLHCLVTLMSSSIQKRT
jgi:Mycotoxin biosynthesis protein UstYa